MKIFMRRPDSSWKIAELCSNCGAMSYRSIDEKAPSCMHCGAPVYGRTDKKFCSPECKDRYNYLKKAELQRYRRHILMNIRRNYAILENLINEGIRTADRQDIEELGFRSGCMTGFRKHRDKEMEYRCFDICYCMTGTRIYKICRLNTKNPPPAGIPAED